MLLKEKTALITGSERGIGRAIAIELAKNGADIILNDLDMQALEETAAMIREEGRKAVISEGDVSSSAHVEKIVEKGLQEFNKIDILVNNAGITRDGLIMRMKEEDWDLVLNVNLKSAFLMTKAVSRHMMKARYGKIVNISSVIGLIGNFGQANYSASKAGLIGLTKSSAKELASRNINVNAIAPGFIQTAMTDKLPEEVKKDLISKIPAGVLGTSRDVANLVLFLSADSSKYITGQVINVDGGMVM